MSVSSEHTHTHTQVYTRKILFDIHILHYFMLVFMQTHVMCRI